MANDGFKLFFSSAAKTKKQIEDEVKRLIRSKIENVVEEAIRDAAETIFSGGEKIPPRRDDISYETGKRTGERPLSADEIAYPPEAPQQENSELYERTRKMRRLGETLHNGYMLRECAEITIVKQGEFMQDVTDDFGKHAFCRMERPLYGAMTYEQLRTYFTWRTDVRRGVYNEVDKPYIILYCYELMNKIGVLSAQDAFTRLAAVWENCRSFCHSLDDIMPIWLKDFYAYNNFDVEFSELEKTFPVTTAADSVIEELAAGHYKSKLEYLMSCSTYNLKGSIFYKEEGTPALMDAALEAALKALEKYFRARDISLFELICGRPRKQRDWIPFSGAYVNQDRLDGFRPCKISTVERYCVKRGQPSLECFEYAPYRNFIGYILKSVESVLRKRTGFRYSISANINPVLEDFANREKLQAAITDEAFQSVIPDAVNAFCGRRGIYPPVKGKKRKKSEEEYISPEYGPAQPPKTVEIDVAGLDRIRAESEEIARKLIIDEETEEITDITHPADIDDVTMDSIAEMTAQIEDEVFEERAEEAAQEHGISEAAGSFPSEWQELATALDIGSVQVLRAVLDGDAERFCRERGILPEAAYELINEAALESMGDILIENGELLEDYREDAVRFIQAMS